MAKYNFSTLGAASQCNNYYSVKFYRDSIVGGSIKTYTLATPLDEDELDSFIQSRVSSLNRLGFHITTAPVSQMDEETPRIGLNGLAFLLSGKGITPVTIDVKFDGKVYKVDVDKYAKFLESMQ